MGCRVVDCCFGGCLVYLALVYFIRSDAAKALKLRKSDNGCSLGAECCVGENVRPFSSSLLSSSDR